MNIERETKAKSILITQPEPEPGRNVYEDFVNRYKLTMDFRALIHIEPLTAREIRKQKINFFQREKEALSFQVTNICNEAIKAFKRATRELE